jgi:glycosyltransferase involved in cell wall biosynthesis
MFSDVSEVAMIKVLNLNSGGGYGGPERAIESYTRYGRGVGFVYSGYYLLNFPGSTQHIACVEGAGGSVTLFGQRHEGAKVDPVEERSASWWHRNMSWKATAKNFLPQWATVEWESYGWAKKTRRMITGQLKSIPCRPDLCHIHASFYFMSAGIYQCCREVFPGVPVVVHFHNGPVFAKPGFWERRMVRGADLCLFNSRYCEQAWRMVAKPQRAKIMPNPIEFPPDAASTRSLHDRKIVVGTMGRLSPIKGVDVAIKACTEVMKKDERVHLEIAGEGPEEQHLRALASASGFADRIHFLSFVSDVHAVLKRWHILLQPTKTIEAFGMTVIEAMACRCIIIASRVGGLPENVIDGRTGYLVEPGDDVALAKTILKMLDDKEVYSAMIEAGYRHARHYEAQSATSELAEAYRELVR